jgi:hypothetical protein
MPKGKGIFDKPNYTNLLARIAHALEEIARVLANGQVTQAELTQALSLIHGNTRGILGAQEKSQGKEESIMAQPVTGQDLVDAIKNQRTVVAGLKTYTAGLRQKILDLSAASGGSLTQAQLEQAFADISDNDQAIADAMVENTGP